LLEDIGAEPIGRLWPLGYTIPAVAAGCEFHQKFRTRLAICDLQILSRIFSPLLIGELSVHSDVALYLAYSLDLFTWPIHLAYSLGLWNRQSFTDFLHRFLCILAKSKALQLLNFIHCQAGGLDNGFNGQFA